MTSYKSTWKFEKMFTFFLVGIFLGMSFMFIQGSSSYYLLLTLYFLAALHHAHHGFDAIFTDYIHNVNARALSRFYLVVISVASFGMVVVMFLEVAGIIFHTPLL